MNISRMACAPADLRAISLAQDYQSPSAAWAMPAFNNGATHRAWDWPAASPLADLPMPAGFVRAAAATAGWFIGGYGTASDGATRPVCWDWAFNPTDMLPRGATSGVIVAADPDGGLDVTGLGGSVVEAGGNGLSRAAFWPNPPQNMIVDLHPASPDYVASSVHAVRCVGAQMRQAGMAVVCPAPGPHGDRRCHAMAWYGTAASAFDLHALLPDEYLHSTATFIDEAGNVAGAAQDVNGVWHSVFWARA
jgi:hypothetical protein